MMSNSSRVSRPGLFRIASSIAILPMSCSDDAMTISSCCSGVRAYWSVFWVSCSSRYRVSVLICSTWVPLSPLRNSTASLRIEISIWVFFSFSRIWLVTSEMSRRCLA